MSDFTVFICGTFADLQQERRSVLEAVEALRLRHDSMEYFGARDARPLDVCLEEVRKSDVLVVIVGHRYGSLATDLGISYSEAEYRAALELNKPCYVFFKSDDVELKPREMELDPDKLRLLLAWKKALSDRHTVAVFGTPAELAVRVVAALNKVIEAQRAAAVNVGTRASHAGVREVVDGVDDLVELTLDAGYSPGIVIGAIRAALASFTSRKERLGVRVVILSGGDAAGATRVIAQALEKQGSDVWLEPLDDQSVRPGHLTGVLESAEIVLVLASSALHPEPWLMRELEAAIWRYMALPNGVAVIPVSIDNAAVPPLLRALAHVQIDTTDIAVGLGELIAAIDKYKIQRDAKGVQVVRAAGMLRRPA